MGKRKGLRNSLITGGSTIGLRTFAIGAINEGEIDREYHQERKPEMFQRLFSTGKPYSFPGIYTWLIAEIALKIDATTPVDGDTVLKYTRIAFKDIVLEYPAYVKKHTTDGYRTYEAGFTYYMRKYIPIQVNDLLNTYILRKTIDGPQS